MDIEKKTKYSIIENYVKDNKEMFIAMDYFYKYIVQIKNKKRTDLLFNLNNILCNYYIEKDDILNYMIDIYFKYYSKYDIINSDIFYFDDNIKIPCEDINFYDYFESWKLKQINKKNSILMSQLLKKYNNYRKFNNKQPITRSNKFYIKLKKEKFNKREKYYWLINE
jgi:hypothetical protein